MSAVQSVLFQYKRIAAAGFLLIFLICTFLVISDKGSIALSSLFSLSKSAKFAKDASYKGDPSWTDKKHKKKRHGKKNHWQMMQPPQFHHNSMDDFVFEDHDRLYSHPPSLHPRPPRNSIHFYEDRFEAAAKKKRPAGDRLFSRHLKDLCWKKVHSPI